MYKRTRFIKKRFLDLFFLVLTFHWRHCQAEINQANRLLRRVHKVGESLGKHNVISRNIPYLQYCDYKKHIYTNVIDFADNVINSGILTGFLKECTSIYASGSTTSGIYPIWLKERFQFTYVYCDMELVSTKKGWTTIQRRMNGEVNFNRGWDDYVRGFGNPRSEYWLGLENIYRLSRQTAKAFEDGVTSITAPKLGIDLEDWDGFKEFAQYRTFLYRPNSKKYYLHVVGLNGSEYFNNAPIYQSKFSTPDANNDETRNRHCARKYKSGWWFHGCGISNLNGPYPKYKQQMSWNNIYWFGWTDLNLNGTALRFVSMNLYHDNP
ncbi:unnamed protein product [Clavelina lepadiformis]|uniref:Fibrinogen C-terminal domain-containing protein n=1 Tax=Clavelina lepadiformis TaxID=159417 RepID=A0ABP0G9X0_CLALP